MPQQFDNDRIAEIRRRREEGQDVVKIAAEMGISTSTVSKYSEPSATPPTETVDAVEKAAASAAKSRELRRERDLLMAVAGERSFRRFLEDIMRDVAPRFDAIKPTNGKPPKEDASKETMLFHWSDWHAFEEILPERTMGFNEFNGDILCERVKRLVLSSISIKQRLERGGGWQFDEAVIALNGDFISGTIHEVERHSDASNVVHASFATGLLVAAAIRDVARHFKAVRVRCTPGNHGRLPDAKRMQVKDPTRNWDTFIYLFAMTALRDCSTITFHIPESYFDVYDVVGWRFLQVHGDAIKSWNALPHYGLDRFTRNMNALFGSRSERIDYYLFGHFHNQTTTSSASGENFIGGSLCGGSEFSIGQLGRSDRPTQWLFQVDDEHGVTGRWPILGTGKDQVTPYDLPAWPAVS
jgi:hypothetical protein